MTLAQNARSILRTQAQSPIQNIERRAADRGGHPVGSGGRRCSLSQAAVAVSSQSPPATASTAASASSTEGLGSQAQPLISTNNRNDTHAARLLPSGSG